MLSDELQTAILGGDEASARRFAILMINNNNYSGFFRKITSIAIRYVGIAEPQLAGFIWNIHQDFIAVYATATQRQNSAGGWRILRNAPVVRGWAAVLSTMLVRANKSDCVKQVIDQHFRESQPLPDAEVEHMREGRIHMNILLRNEDKSTEQIDSEAFMRRDWLRLHLRTYDNPIEWVSYVPFAHMLRFLLSYFDASDPITSTRVDLTQQQVIVEKYLFHVLGKIWLYHNDTHVHVSSTKATSLHENTAAWVFKNVAPCSVQPEAKRAINALLSMFHHRRTGSVLNAVHGKGFLIYAMLMYTRRHSIRWDQALPDISQITPQLVSSEWERVTGQT